MTISPRPIPKPPPLGASPVDGSPGGPLLREVRPLQPRFVFLPDEAALQAHRQALLDSVGKWEDESLRQLDESLAKQLQACTDAGARRKAEYCARIDAKLKEKTALVGKAHWERLRIMRELFSERAKSYLGEPGFEFPPVEVLVAEKNVGCGRGEIVEAPKVRAPDPDDSRRAAGAGDGIRFVAAGSGPGKAVPNTAASLPEEKIETAVKTGPATDRFLEALHKVLSTSSTADETSTSHHCDEVGMGLYECAAPITIRKLTSGSGAATTPLCDVLRRFFHDVVALTNARHVLSVVSAHLRSLEDAIDPMKKLLRDPNLSTEELVFLTSQRSGSGETAPAGQQEQGGKRTDSDAPLSYAQFRQIWLKVVRAVYLELNEKRRLEGLGGGAAERTGEEKERLLSPNNRADGAERELALRFSQAAFAGSSESPEFATRRPRSRGRNKEKENDHQRQETSPKTSSVFPGLLRGNNEQAPATTPSSGPSPAPAPPAATTAGGSSSLGSTSAVTRKIALLDERLAAAGGDEVRATASFSGNSTNKTPTDLKIKAAVVVKEQSDAPSLDHITFEHLQAVTSGAAADASNGDVESLAAKLKELQEVREQFFRDKEKQSKMQVEGGRKRKSTEEGRDFFLQDRRPVEIGPAGAIVDADTGSVHQAPVALASPSDPASTSSSPRFATDFVAEMRASQRSSDVDNESLCTAINCRIQRKRSRLLSDRSETDTVPDFETLLVAAGGQQVDEVPGTDAPLPGVQPEKLPTRTGRPSGVPLSAGAQDSIPAGTKKKEKLHLNMDLGSFRLSDADLAEIEQEIDRRKQEVRDIANRLAYDHEPGAGAEGHSPGAPRAGSRSPKNMARQFLFEVEQEWEAERKKEKQDAAS
eukprot:g1050.t1